MTDTVTPTTTTVVVSAGDLAYSWQAVTKACATMEDRPILGGVQIEVYGPDTIRITATDSYMLLTSVIGRGIRINDLDATPDSTWIVNPLATISLATMKEIVRSYRPGTVTFTFTEDGADLCVKESVGEIRLHLPVIEGEYPNWRKLVRGAEAKTRSDDGIVALGFLTLPTLAALADDSRQIELKVAGSLDPVLMNVRSNDGWPPVSGLVMPVRLT